MKNSLHRLFVLALAGLFLSLFFACTSDEEPQVNCNDNCQNGGVLSIDCECICPAGFTGEFCEDSTCSLECQNGGTITQNCSCDCPEGFEGESCENCVSRCNIITTNELFKSENGQRPPSDNKISLPEKYVLTGLGFSDVATLKLTGRELLSDCTLGDPIEFFDGSNPSGAVDVSYTVPDGHVITGVGFGESQGIYRLVVNYNELLSDENCDLYLGPEQLYDNNVNRIVEVWLKISDTPFDTRFNLFGGLGIKYSGSSNRLIETEMREIINLF